MAQKYIVNYKQLAKGDKIEELLESHEYWKIKEAERILQESEGKYRESKQKKWIIMTLGLILGGFLGYYIPVFAFRLGNSAYQRGPIDNLLKEMFGN
jgi:hypothetical protein